MYNNRGTVRKTNIVVRSLNHCCRVNATNNFSLYFWETKIVWESYDAFNNINILKSSRKCPAVLSDFNQIWISRQTRIEITNIKFHENTSSGNRADACGQTGGRADGETWRRQWALFATFASTLKVSLKFTILTVSFQSERLSLLVGLSRGWLESILTRR
jgi:hypothetical protein